MAEKNRVRMIDVGPKPDSERESVARGRMKMKAATLDMVRKGKLPKGDCLAAAQVAGIMAAKKTPELIPLCHPLLLNDVKVEYAFDEEGLEITASVRTVGKTGVEMEALTAVAVAALTVYDMCKAVDRGIRIEGVRLARKSGGKSGKIVLE
jgi:cyclic pyranopterin phosphate synthase